MEDRYVIYEQCGNGGDIAFKSDLYSEAEDYLMNRMEDARNDAEKNGEEFDEQDFLSRFSGIETVTYPDRYEIPEKDMNAIEKMSQNTSYELQDKMSLRSEKSDNLKVRVIIEKQYYDEDLTKSLGDEHNIVTAKFMCEDEIGHSYICAKKEDVKVSELEETLESMQFEDTFPDYTYETIRTATAEKDPIPNLGKETLGQAAESLQADMERVLTASKSNYDMTR